jgi:hypothetical protein
MVQDKEEARVDGAARVLDRDRGRSVSVGQCRIVEAELRGTNSDLKTGCVEIAAEFSPPACRKEESSS